MEHINTQSIVHTDCSLLVMGKESKKMYTLGNLADSMFDDLTFCKKL